MTTPLPIPLIMSDGNFNAVVEDQRNIVTVSEEAPNTIFITVPGTTYSLGAGVVYGSGVPWEIEVEI